MPITVASIGGILFLSLFFSWIFKKFDIPDVLPLFVIGLLLGPVFNLVDIDSYQVIGEIFATLTLSIILFEAGLHVKIRSLFESASRATFLIFLQLIATVIVVVPISKFVFDTTWLMGLAIGIILSGTSATIVIPLIQNFKLEEKTKTLLKLEGVLGNIIVIVLVFGLLDAIENNFFSVQAILNQLASTFVLSTIIGFLSALVWSQIVSKLRGIQDSLFTTPAFLLVLFGLTELIGSSGAMAVFAFGITLGNLQGLKLSSFKLFKRFKNFHLTRKEETLFSSLVFVVKTYFFIFIGLSINLQDWTYIVWGAVLAAALFLARAFIMDVFFKGTMPDFDLRVVKVMAPRGLTEAALLTFIGSTFLSNVSYPVIMFSIVFSSILAFYTKSQFQEGEIEPTSSEYSADHPSYSSFHKLP